MAPIAPGSPFGPVGPAGPFCPFCPGWPGSPLSPLEPPETASSATMAAPATVKRIRFSPYETRPKRLLSPILAPDCDRRIQSSALTWGHNRPSIVTWLDLVEPFAEAGAMPAAPFARLNRKADRDTADWRRDPCIVERSLPASRSRWRPFTRKLSPHP